MKGAVGAGVTGLWSELGVWAGAGRSSVRVWAMKPWAQSWSRAWTRYQGLLTASRAAPDPGPGPGFWFWGFHWGSGPGPPVRLEVRPFLRGWLRLFLADEGSLVRMLALHLRQKLNRRVFVLASFAGRLGCRVLVSECKVCTGKGSDGRCPG